MPELSLEDAIGLVRTAAKQAKALATLDDALDGVLSLAKNTAALDEQKQSLDQSVAVATAELAGLRASLATERDNQLAYLAERTAQVERDCTAKWEETNSRCEAIVAAIKEQNAALTIENARLEANREAVTATCLSLEAEEEELVEKLAALRAQAAQIAS